MQLKKIIFINFILSLVYHFGFAQNPFHLESKVITETTSKASGGFYGECLDS